jgi:hypothetical protein
MTPWTRTQQQIATIATAIPEIATKRLILRVPRMDDRALPEPIDTTECAIHNGEPMSPVDASFDFSQLVAGWVLRGHDAKRYGAHPLKACVAINRYSDKGPLQ